MSSMFDALQVLRFDAAREAMNDELLEIPPPPPRGGDSLYRCCGICACLTSQELEVCLHCLFNLMTRSEDVPRFKDMITSLNQKELTRMASLLTSNSDYFIMIARNKYGSKRLQMLLGISDDVDVFFSRAIMRLVLQVMTDNHASYVAIRGLRVFHKRKKELMYEYILQYALHLACDQHGCIALNEIITDLDDPYYRNEFLDIVAHNALLLSNDSYGNFVVQRVLKLHDLRCTYNIAISLRGHYTELSFKKYGSYIVERLLEGEDSVMEVVVMDLLECEGERLMRLARSEYGNFVVAKAMRSTRDIFTAHLYNGLVDKLMPYRHLLFKSPGRNIATILDTIMQRRSSMSQTS